MVVEFIISWHLLTLPSITEGISDVIIIHWETIDFFVRDCGHFRLLFTKPKILYQQCIAIMRIATRNSCDTKVH